MECDRGALVGVGDAGAVDGDDAAGGGVETGDQSQERRFAASGRSDDGDDLTGAEIGVESAQHLSKPLGDGEVALDALQTHGGGGSRGRGRLGAR